VSLSEPSAALPGDSGAGLAPPARPDPAVPPDRRPTVEVLVHRLDPGVPPPAYALPGDAGADIVTTVDVDLAPGARAVLPTGLAIALPPGHAAFVHPRSGLAARVGLGLVNAPGTIDEGYRGEIKVVVINHDRSAPLRLRRGERIAQLVVQRVERVRFTEVARLPRSERGAGGYGSTGGALALTAPGPLRSAPATADPTGRTTDPWP
jgi:dUTP pyrophosphatase